MATKKPPTKSATKVRARKAPSYRSFRLNKRIKHVANKPLPPSWRLAITALKHLRRNWKLFAAITLIYGLLMLVFVKGVSSGMDIRALKDTLSELFQQQNSGSLAVGVALFGLLVGSSATASGVGGAYQTFLVLIGSLAMIWGLRSTSNDKAAATVTVRNAYYKGTAALIPLILVVFVISIQLLPLALANFLYTNVIVGGLAINAFEQGVWIILMLLMALLSLYMITSSVFAFYIVSLPDMTPLKALRSARQLVLHRRSEVLRKIFFVAIILMVSIAALVIPVIIIVPVAAEWVLFGCTIAALLVIHAYMYTLYRELL